MQLTYLCIPQCYTPLEQNCKIYIICSLQSPGKPSTLVPTCRHACNFSIIVLKFGRLSGIPCQHKPMMWYLETELFNVGGIIYSCFLSGVGMLLPLISGCYSLENACNCKDFGNYQTANLFWHNIWKGKSKCQIHIRTAIHIHLPEHSIVQRYLYFRLISTNLITAQYIKIFLM